MKETVLAYIGNHHKQIGANGNMSRTEFERLKQIIRNNRLTHISAEADKWPGSSTNTNFDTAEIALANVRVGKYDPDKRPRFEAVKQDTGEWTVKTKKGKKWYTVCDTFLVPKFGDAAETAQQIAKLLNDADFQGQLTSNRD